MFPGRPALCLRNARGAAPIPVHMTRLLPLLRRVSSTAARRSDDERGVAEAWTAIIVLPILVAALFLLVEAGLNMRTRATLDHIVQDTVRSVALDGGNFNPRTNVIGTSWSAKGLATLKNACSNGSMRCKTVPTMTCTDATPGTPDVAEMVGETVRCTATVEYKPVSMMSSNPLWSFGMSGLFTQPLTVTVESIAATGVNG